MLASLIQVSHDIVILSTPATFIRVNASPKAIGAPAGEHLISELLPKLQDSATDETGAIVVVDLRRVSLATTSYVKAGLLPLYLAGQRYAEQVGSALSDSAAQPPLNIFPIFANVDLEVFDTLQEVFAGRGMPFLTTNLVEESFTNSKIGGFLDEALVRTMRLIRGREAVTALNLAAEFETEGVKPTAWNNRLNDLWRLRLLRRSKKGKAWWYKPIIKELTYGR